VVAGRKRGPLKSISMGQGSKTEEEEDEEEDLEEATRSPERKRTPLNRISMGQVCDMSKGSVSGVSRPLELVLPARDHDAPRWG
jgi:hypothetical protein